jgi:prepilin-type N-terminal cleavage/methylation domain-containing protein
MMTVESIGCRGAGIHRRGRGFTVIEMMMVILVMSILAVIGLDAVATFEANQRADRAAREALAAFRFAGILAKNTGKKAKVVLDS